jgi:hypothetical protein
MAIDTPADQAAFFATDGFGQPAVYTALGSGSPKAVTVIVDKDRDRYVSEGQLLVTQKSTAIITLCAEIPAPKRGDTITESGVVYTIDEIGEDDGVVRDLVVR